MSPWIIDPCANQRIEVIEGMFTQPTTKTPAGAQSDRPIGSGQRWDTPYTGNADSMYPTDIVVVGLSERPERGYFKR